MKAGRGRALTAPRGPQTLADTSPKEVPTMPKVVIVPNVVDAEERWVQAVALLIEAGLQDPA